jgi:hypothetical protein
MVSGSEAIQLVALFQSAHALLFSVDAGTFVNGVYAVLINAAPLVSLGCFVAATLAFRSGGGTNFEFGSPFVQWLFWGFIFIGLPGLTGIFHTLGLPDLNAHTPYAGGMPAYMKAIVDATDKFVHGFLIDKLVPAAAGALVLKALFDAAEEQSPVGSIISAMLILGVGSLYTLAQGWVGADANVNGGGDGFGVATGFLNLVKWGGASVCPAVGALCIIGAVINFVRGKPWGQMVFTAIGMLSFSGIWLLVQHWG